jgi:NAD(P)-dependent dehydrogenase (short-subunit alcohol dehydrogenase family)
MAVIDKTIAFISGANQGIGAATAARLAKEYNYHVIIGSRNLENGNKVATQIKSEGFSAEAVQLHVLSDESIEAAAKYVTDTYGHVDVLINNAGISIEGDQKMSTRQLYERTLSTNVTGAACLTTAFLPLLRASKQKPRVIFLSSIMGSISKSLDSSTPWYPIDYQAYDTSKAALNMVMVNFVRILAEKGARVNSVCPGLVSSNLTNFIAWGTSAEVGAQRVVELATVTGKDSDVTGTFSNADGPLAW